MTDPSHLPSEPTPSSESSRGVLLAVLGIILIVFGLTIEIPLANLPVILIGALLVILHEFHSRIHGVIGLSKFRATVVSEHSVTQPPATPTDLEAHRRAKESAELRDVSKHEWNLPTRQRGKSR